jgi:hypothetical protein
VLAELRSANDLTTQHDAKNVSLQLCAIAPGLDGVAILEGAGNDGVAAAIWRHAPT